MKYSAPGTPPGPSKGPKKIFEKIFLNKIFLVGLGRQTAPGHLFSVDLSPICNIQCYPGVLRQPWGSWRRLAAILG